MSLSRKGHITSASYGCSTAGTMAFHTFKVRCLPCYFLHLLWTPKIPIFLTLSTTLYVTQCICNTLNLASTYANPSKHLFPTCFVPNMSSYASSATLQGAATFGPGLYNCLILAKELQHPRSPMRYRHQLSLSTMDYDLSKSRASVGTMRNERWVSWGPDR